MKEKKTNASPCMYMLMNIGGNFKRMTHFTFSQQKGFKPSNRALKPASIHQLFRYQNMQISVLYNFEINRFIT